MIVHTKIPKSKRHKTQRARQLQQQWNQLLERWEPVAQVKGLATKTPAPYRRETKHIPSLNSHSGQCTKPETPQYTGTAMMGIATMHKSNAVPVFSQEQAEEISRMRRG